MLIKILTTVHVVVSFYTSIHKECKQMVDMYQKKIVFDVEVMPHLFVLSAQKLDGYDTDGPVESFSTVESALDYINRNSDALFVGYNSNGYDDYIISAIINRDGEISPEELSAISTEIIEGDGSNRIRKSFLSYDVFDPVEAGMRSLKMFCGSAGRSTYDSPYSFKDNRYYNDDEIKDICRYCEEDVGYTVEIMQRETGFYEASLARLDILRDAGVVVQNPKRCLCCRSAAFGRYLFQGLCGQRDPNDNSRTSIRFIRDYANSPYEEVRTAYAFYAAIVASMDETSPKNVFYDKDSAPSFDNFTPEMGINLGWGGAHGAIEGYKFKANDKTALLYVDVSSMYPTLLVKHDLYPYTFSEAAKEVYQFTYESRLSYKANGEAIKSQACKRIIASLTGMLKDQFATFRAEWSNNSIVINGQLSILDMSCRLRAEEGWRIVQANTDGVMVEVPNTKAARDRFSQITDEWCADYKFGVSAKEIAVLIQTNVNNYYMTIVGHEDEEPTLKGAAYSYNEGYFRDKTVVKKALVDCLKDGITPEEALKKYTDIRDYFILIKNTDTFPWLWDVLSDERKEARCVRVIASNNNMKKIIENDLKMCYYMKARTKDDTKGQKVTNFPENAIEIPLDLSAYDHGALFDVLDKSYYVDQIQRAIDIFNGAKS